MSVDGVEPKTIRVSGVFAPWHVTKEIIRPEGEVGTYNDQSIARLYRDDLEVFTVGWRYLHEVDDALQKIHRAMVTFEEYRLMTLAMAVGLREAEQEKSNEHERTD